MIKHIKLSLRKLTANYNLLTTHRRAVSIAAVLLILVLAPLLWWQLRHPAQTSAWYNDHYAHRQYFSFTHDADISAERAITFSLDTAELITDGVMESDCADTRFTDLNGKLLDYELTGTCNDAATTYEVVFTQIHNGLNAGYVYYGNPSAISASQDVSAVTALTPSGGDPSITTRTSEEDSPGFTAIWNFNQGADNTCPGGEDACDMGGNYHGTFSGSPLWMKENPATQARSAYLQFDGSDDYVDIGAVDETIKSIGFWLRVSSLKPQKIIDFNGSDYVEIDSSQQINAVSFPGTTVYYVNGQVSQTISANTWQFVMITDSTGVTPSDMDIGGKIDATAEYFQGWLDEVKLYAYVRSAAQVNLDYNSVSGQGSSTNFGGPQDNLTDGLVGWYKMDESSWAGTPDEVLDASEHRQHAAAVADATTTGGKYGSGGTFDGTGDYVQTGTSWDLEINGPLTLAAWIKPGTVASEQTLLGKWEEETGVDNRSYRMFINSSAKLCAEISSDGTSGTVYQECSDTSLVTTAYTHVQMLVEPADDGNLDIKLYLNGEEDTTTTSGSAISSIHNYE